ncbi:MAG TPA: phytanoyl-CoA dioxygenase family protein [Thermoanaerobaculia bacterium]|jgi:ectoine hydroxylase-related dioxygenase (phytanoyl-CoA dioxygenase family)|nr:phytanoyl-CoA dioxygenase family protein [Thermoanaerobaculia bacterium]
MFRRPAANPFASTLWIDQPNAGEVIAERRRAGKLSDEDADLLDHFRNEGYVRVVLDPEKEPIDELVNDLDRLWAEKPNDLLYASGLPNLRTMSLATDEERRPGSRLQEIQSHSRAARRLYLHPRLHAIAHRILGEPAMAIQSILFEFGSAQALHRDPVFVPTPVPGHLLAAWIALEDIHPDSGPLRYVPRSHAFPPFEFRPGLYRYDPKLVGEEESRREQEWLRDEMKTHGVQPVSFLPRKGEVFFWHAGLYHGGEPIRDVARTRKSFVVHYSTRRSHRQHVNTVQGSDGRVNLVRTRELIRDGNAVGFNNALAAADQSWGYTFGERLAALWARL